MTGNGKWPTGHVIRRPRNASSASHQSGRPWCGPGTFKRFRADADQVIEPESLVRTADLTDDTKTPRCLRPASGRPTGTNWPKAVAFAAFSHVTTSDHTGRGVGRWPVFVVPSCAHPAFTAIGTSPSSQAMLVGRGGVAMRPSALPQTTWAASISALRRGGCSSPRPWMPSAGSQPK
jgi:hypothetical protein